MNVRGCLKNTNGKFSIDSIDKDENFNTQIEAKQKSKQLLISAIQIHFMIEGADKRRTHQYEENTPHDA